MDPLIILAIIFGAMLVYVFAKLLSTPSEEKRKTPEPKPPAPPAKSASQRSPQAKEFATWLEKQRAAKGTQPPPQPQSKNSNETKQSPQPQQVPVLKPVKAHAKSLQLLPQPSAPTPSTSRTTSPSTSRTTSPSPTRTPVSSNGTSTQNQSAPLPLVQPDSIPAILDSELVPEEHKALQVRIPRSAYSPQPHGSAGSPSETAKHIRSMLSHTSTARSAILLAEVLGPPVSRTRRS